jgi:D-3-phosphoglycerate dehydrogenase / 2-oxoglutarate reductase
VTDIVVTDQSFGGVAREQALAERFGLSFAEYQLREEDPTADAVRGARIVFDNFAPMTERVLSGLANDAVVIRYGIGYDNVDVDAARRLGVRVCNVPDYGVSTVADHTVALLLALLRKVHRFDAEVRSRGWFAPGDLGPLPGFADTTVGLVGSGRIGRAVLDRLRPFGFKLDIYDPFVSDDDVVALGARPCGFEELLAESQAVSIHTPLTDATRHLFGEAAFAVMRPGAYLVNTSRGGMVEEGALAAAIRSGRLGGAALDVFESEPLPVESGLRTLPNVILTPHTAFFSDAALAALQRLATEEAERALTGVPLRCPVT